MFRFFQRRTAPKKDASTQTTSALTTETSASLCSSPAATYHEEQKFFSEKDIIPTRYKKENQSLETVYVYVRSDIFKLDEFSASVSFPNSYFQNAAQYLNHLSSLTDFEVFPSYERAQAKNHTLHENRDYIAKITLPQKALSLQGRFIMASKGCVIDVSDIQKLHPAVSLRGHSERQGEEILKLQRKGIDNPMIEKQEAQSALGCIFV